MTTGCVCRTRLSLEHLFPARRMWTPGSIVVVHARRRGGTLVARTAGSVVRPCFRPAMPWIASLHTPATARVH